MSRARPGPLVQTLPVPTPFPVGPVNVHLILREPITLIDAGPWTDEAWEALRSGLAAHRLSVRDVERVLLTHGHHDHFGLARRVADASGATLHGGRLDARQFGMRRASKRGLDELARAGFGLGERLAVSASGAWVDRFAQPLAEWDELAGGETLPGDGYSIAVRSTPGHTPGSLSFEVPEAGLLFTGDTVLHRITPNAVVVEDPEREGQAFRSVTRYRQTLAELERTHAASLLLTGHGATIRDFPAHRRRQEERHRRRERALLAELSAGPRTVRELVSAIFPRLGPLNLFLAYSEVAGFLMYLEDVGCVERRRGVLRDSYRAVPPAA